MAMADEADEDTLMQTVADTTRPTAERVAAVVRLGAPAGSNYWTEVNYAVSRLLCGILYASAEDPQVRIAAAQALSGRNRAAAPNQLSRYLEGDPDRKVRAAVAALFAHWGAVPESQEPGLQRDLETLQARVATLPLANLASTYGGDPRVVAMLRKALRHSDPDIRYYAQLGLGFLGHLKEVRHALQDDAPTVRAAAAETLGFYSLKSSDDVSALDGALRDADPQVRRAAKTALRRLGMLPTPTPPPSAQLPTCKLTPPPRPMGSAAGRPAIAGSSSTGQPGVEPGPAEWRALLERWSGAW